MSPRPHLVGVYQRRGGARHKIYAEGWERGEGVDVFAALSDRAGL